MPNPKNTPCVLVIRDGWGHNPNPGHDPFNAVKLASTPVAHRLMREYPNTLIKTSGEDVGLPEGTMGNSEVGHQNIGAGRIVDQESVAITKACRAGLQNNHVIADAIQTVAKRHATLHLMGICSDAGVHGLLTHLEALVRAAKHFALQPNQIAIHLFTDGRDTGPYTAKAFAQRVEQALKDIGVGRIASVCGRYWAMDRDNRWERVQRAYDMLTARAKDLPRFPSAADAIQHHYDHPADQGLQGDEFVPPSLIADPAPIKNRDAVIFYNYRGDRPREISAAFVFPDSAWAAVKPSPDSGVQGFDRGPRLDIDFITMTAYWEELTPYVKVAFAKPPKMADILGMYAAALDIPQFRCAETEKFPHVTFFFNDYRDEPFPKEQREIIQSPKVATYDLAPEMSAAGVRDAVLRRIAAPDCQQLIVVNFANADMVGHTGSLPAAIKACEFVDQCAGAIVDATLARGGSLIVTADHGNAEQMFDPITNSPHTSHTTYDVPLIVVASQFKQRMLREGGRLADIAPTMLDMMGIPKPAAMSGLSLLA